MGLPFSHFAAIQTRRQIYARTQHSVRKLVLKCGSCCARGMPCSRRRWRTRLRARRTVSRPRMSPRVFCESQIGQASSLCTMYNTVPVPFERLTMRFRGFEIADSSVTTVRRRQPLIPVVPCHVWADADVLKTSACSCASCSTRTDRQVSTSARAVHARAAVEVREEAVVRR
jgi:hypothetical protein